MWFSAEALGWVTKHGSAPALVTTSPQTSGGVLGRPRRGVSQPMRNLDERTVSSFGEEWSSYDQTLLPEDEAQRRFGEYFSLIRWDRLPAGAVVSDRLARS